MTETRRVPVEATDDMVMHGIVSLSGRRSVSIGDNDLAAAYRAMVAAAPPDASGRGDAFARSAAIAILKRLIANYRDQIGDSDLDDEQPIAITFRGTLADIRQARRASALLSRPDTAPTRYGPPSCEKCGLKHPNTDCDPGFNFENIFGPDTGEAGVLLRDCRALLIETRSFTRHNMPECARGPCICELDELRARIDAHLSGEKKDGT